MTSVLVLAHPDDETAMFGKLRQLQQNNDVFVIVISQGETVNGSSRLGEFRNAMRSINIPSSQYITLDIAEKDNYDALFDRNSEHFMRVYETLRDELRVRNPHQVFVTGFQGGNVFHDMANFLTRKAVTGTSDVPVYEFPSYEWQSPITLKGFRSYFRFCRFGDQYCHDAPENGFSYEVPASVLEEKIVYPNVYTSAKAFFDYVLRNTQQDSELWRIEHFREVPVNRDYRVRPTTVMFYSMHGRLVKLMTDWRRFIRGPGQPSDTKRIRRVVKFSDFRHMVRTIEMML